MDGYKTEKRLIVLEWSVYKLAAIQLSTNEKLSVSSQFSENYGVASYGSGWRKDVVNQCLEFNL